MHARIAGWWLVVGLLLWGGWVQAAGLRIDITKGGLQPMPIALPDFVEIGAGGPVKGEGVGPKLTEIVTADLERSGLFTPVDRKAFLQDAVSLWKEGPNYRDWRLVGAEAVVAGAVQDVGGKLTVDFYLYDIFRGGPIGQGKRFTANSSDLRHVAHRVADEIYTRMTGEGGYFASRIAFMARSGKRSWLSVMDQDGANRSDLTTGGAMVLTPRFSPNGENLFYLSYESGEPRIFRWELYTGRKVRQSNYPGLNSAPSWSPDGRKMALTLSKDGNPEIYLMDLASGTLERMTFNNAIDTSPSWAPNGERIVFNSDRGGSPQIYVMNADGGDQHRITFDGRYNTAPSWSPRGDQIVFIHGGGGQFNLAVIDPEGKRSKVITSSWMDDTPSWSPNGRVIVFAREAGNHSKLYTVDVTGYNERLVPLDGGMDGLDPSWSPLIR